MQRRMRATPQHQVGCVAEKLPCPPSSPHSPLQGQVPGVPPAFTLNCPAPTVAFPENLEVWVGRGTQGGCFGSGTTPQLKAGGVWCCWGSWVIAEGSDGSRVTGGSCRCSVNDAAREKAVWLGQQRQELCAQKTAGEVQGQREFGSCIQCGPESPELSRVKAREV